ncbi:MAG: hypothetical protein Q7R54_00080 [bacterium]|nr:hypothetical protein [bacterium]
MQNHSSKKRLVWENVLKHALIVVCLYFFYSSTKSFVQGLATDSIGQQTIVVLSSLLIMAFLFSTYTFTFKDSNLQNGWRRLFDQLNTGITVFGCGALLEISYITINAQLHAEFKLMGLLMVLFYVALVIFDFWDLMRNKIFE